MTSPPDTTGAPPDDPALCEAAKLLLPESPTATPASPPTWGAGEAIEIAASLHNTGADFNWYPGIQVSADHPLVTADVAENWFYALFADQSLAIGVSFVADPEIPAGTVVTFTIHAAVLNTDCPDLASTTVQATIE